MNNHYVVCAIKNWHIRQFETYSKQLKGSWTLITEKDDLTYAKLESLNPRYVFFPHWSWIVPKNIVDRFECVCFHSSDVPFGRGGSPIQNLIIRGFKETKISALRMCEELDAGPVYLKKGLSLKGSAQEIYENSGNIIAQMIEEIVVKEPSPKTQEGEVVVFKRRGGDENMLPQDGRLEHLYNHIRMLDAETYPRSWIDYGSYKIEFTHASFDGETLTAKVTIKEKS